tara:strand:+ start:1399 stop:1599 length:201 start_codon:yes stop_codon:yes gene_type:complete
MVGSREQQLVDMSIKELKAFKKKILGKIEVFLPELVGDIDEVIAMKEDDGYDPNGLPKDFTDRYHI